MKESKKNIVVNIKESQTIMELSEKLQPFTSDVYLKKIYLGNVLEVNVKSFLGLITLHLENNDSISVRAVGEDCEEVLEVVVNFFTKDA